MSDLEGRVSVEELLPWYLNGSLDDEEQGRVRTALEASAELRERLADLARFAGEATARPDAATLAAFAAGELDEQTNAAIESYLGDSGSGQAADDAALVELARLGLASAEEPAGETLAPPDHVRVVSPPSARPGSRGSSVGMWRGLAAAAVVLAMAGWGTWWLERGGGGVVAGEALESVEFVELAPISTLRSAEGTARSALAGRSAVLLLVEAEIEDASAWSVEARGADGTVAGSWSVASPSDGMVTLLLDAGLLPADATELVLVAQRGEATETVHRYGVR